MKKYFASALTALALLLSGAGLALAGPVSPWYLTAGDQGTNWIIQGASATSYAQNQPGNLGEYAIAVGSTVRTLGNGNNGLGLGSEYTLAGVYTGNNYAYPNTSLRFYDGTRDATHNYSVDFGTGRVYQMNLDWSNATLLFDTGFGGGNALGITFDATNNSLWVSQWGGTTIGDFSLGGALLSSFSTTFSGISSLALDPADNTLWMGSQGTEGTFYQYSKGGVLLSSPSYGALVGQNTLGGEFPFAAGPVVPEPATLTLFAIGMAGMAGYGWRRRKLVVA